MSNTSNPGSCARSCSFAAALLGILVALLLMFMSGWGFFSAVVLGIVIALVVGIVLRKMLCSDAAAADTGTGAAAMPTAPAAAPKADPAPAAPAPSAEPAPAAAPEPVSEQAAEPEETTSVIKPSTPLPGQAELAARKGTWKYEG